MSTIRCVYEKEPKFPATDQHPDAVRYTVGDYVVDAIGKPTLEEVMAVVNPPEPTPLTPLQKLEALGLTAEDIKAIVNT